MDWLRTKIRAILKNNWVVTLSATLIGVFCALYLDEWASNKNLNQKKAIATENIIKEIAANKKSIDNSILKKKEMISTILFLEAYYKEEEFICPVDSMKAFQAEYPHLIFVKDSTLLGDGLCQYYGEINAEMSLPHLNLSNIAWTTLSNSGLSTSYNFECLMYLASLDKLATEIQESNKELFGYFVGLKDPGEDSEQLIKEMKLLLDFEESLSEQYTQCEGELGDC